MMSMRILALSFLLSGSLAHAADPSFEDIQQMLESDPSIDSVEKFLEKLPQEYLESHTLVKDSGSLQEADPKNPRAIVFGKSARTIMTFDHGGRLGNDNIELIQWDELKKKFEFRNIKFASGTAAHISAPNPKSCMRCHANGDLGMMPRWDSYDVWPGLYGAQDDNIYKEMKDFKTYLSHAKTHPRYKFLNRNRTHEAFPYFSSKSTEKSLSDYGKGERGFKTMPNTRLSIHISDLSAQAINQHAIDQGMEGFLALYASLETDGSCASVFYQKLLKKYPQAIAAPKIKKDDYTDKREDLAVQSFLKKIVLLGMGEKQRPFPPEALLEGMPVPTLILDAWDVKPSTLRNQSKPEKRSAHRSGVDRGDPYFTGTSSLAEMMHHRWIEDRYKNEKWLPGARKFMQEEVNYDVPYYEKSPGSLFVPVLRLEACEYYADENPAIKAMIDRVHKDAIEAIDAIYKRHELKDFKLSSANFRSKFAPKPLPAPASAERH